MFEVLFIYPKVLARHQAGPAAVDRERYLTHCAGQGAAHASGCQTRPHAFAHGTSRPNAVNRMSLKCP
jgi:integrase/recombinase XerD